MIVIWFSASHWGLFPWVSFDVVRICNTPRARRLYDEVMQKVNDSYVKITMDKRAGKE